MRILSRTVWAYFVAWLAAALVHTTDANVVGVAGLASWSVIQSVSVLALLVFVPIILCQLLYLRRGRYFWPAAIGFALILATLVAIAGSTASSAGAWILSVLGLAGLGAVMVFIGCLPVLYSRSVWRKVKA